MPFEYLACPHTHDIALVKELRALSAKIALVNLVKSGRNVFSPIAMTHAGDTLFPGTTHAEWMRLDTAHLRVSARLLVLNLLGTSTSKGVGEETDLAIRLMIPIEILEPRAWVPDEIVDLHDAVIQGNEVDIVEGSQLDATFKMVLQYSNARHLLKSYLRLA